MARLSKEWTTPVVVTTMAVISAVLIGTVFMPAIQKSRREVSQARDILNENRAFLAGKDGMESEWAAKKDYFHPGAEADATLSAWIKELLSFAQTQGLMLEKLEPAGVKSGPDGKSVAVFVFFRGDIRKFVSFIYDLTEKDPLSRVESVVTRWEEDSKSLSFELMLVKAVR